MKSTAMARLTVHLPDDLVKRAKDQSVNFSRTLREAVEQQLSDKEQGTPAVTIGRVGNSVEVHVSVPVETLRDQVS